MTRLAWVSVLVALLTACPPSGKNWDRTAELHWEAKILKQKIEVERLKKELAEVSPAEQAERCECGAR